MAKPHRNKAQSATVNRVVLRYGERSEDGEINADFAARSLPQNGFVFDVVTDKIMITVETTATVQNAIERLADHPGPVYIAMTNRDGVNEALTLTDGMSIGVMNPRGEIIKPHRFDSPED